MNFYNCMLIQVRNHVDFVSDFIKTHNDFRTDVTGLSKLSEEELSQVLAIEEEIRKMGRKQPITQAPSWFNYPMTPVASSFIKGAGAYKGKLLLEFHHDPENIYGYDVSGQGAEFFRELMYSDSKGGWVWDKLLGKPSQFGMHKGKFFAYEDKEGKMRFYTTPGAQFVHHFGRPAKFTYNPVGYLSKNQSEYTAIALAGKAWKESLVRPEWSREPIDPTLLREMQRNEAFKRLIPEIKRLKTYEELKPLIEERIKFSSFKDIQKNLREQNETKDLLEKLLHFQMSVNPIIKEMISEE